MLARLVRAASVLSAGTGAVIDTVSYDGPRALGLDARIELFNRLSPEGSELDEQPSDKPTEAAKGDVWAAFHLAGIHQ
jgi:hypothetical protein